MAVDRSKLSTKELKAFRAKIRKAVYKYQATPKGKETKRRAANKHAAKKRRNWTEEERQANLKAQREWKKTPEAREAAVWNKVSWTYGITKEQYLQLLQDQNGVCAICGNPPTKQRLAIDHCHTHNFVRGLLCSHCNTGLGQFKDSMILLNNAITYLEERTR